MDGLLLKDMIVLLLFAVAIVYILQRVKLPSIIGFLITGVIIGPYGFSLIKEVEQVEKISEIGVILLMFVIGMELSIKQLISMKKTVFVGGTLQVVLTVSATAIIFHFMGHAWNEAIFVGFLFSLSSTAIVMKILQDRNELAAPHGRNALAILIFQDIVVVPMMLFTPILAGQTTNITKDVALLLVELVVIIILTLFLAKKVVPKLLFWVAKTRSKELFLLVTITICLVIAFATAQGGLSLALGAFLAGIIISESEYSHQATSIILPFRELFASFFFVSVGMMLNLGFFWQHISVVLLLVLVVLIVKILLVSVAVVALKYPPRTVLLTGFSLFQVGEFAFVISKLGVRYKLLDNETNQYFLAISIITMLLTPFVMLFAEKMADSFSKKRMVRKLSYKTVKNARKNNIHERPDYINHLVIIGYGITGSNLAKAAELHKIPYVVIELNAETVKREKQKGVPIIYGDASRLHILETVNVPAARAVAIAISDSKATRSITRNVRMLSHTAFLVVRIRFLKDTQELMRMGADDVIPEEFETSVQIFSHVLRNFLVPEEDIENFTETVRANDYNLFAHQDRIPKTHRIAVPDFTITSLRITKDDGRIIGKTLRHLNLRAEYGINVLGISREDVMLEEINPDVTIEQGDLVYIQGKQEDIERFRKMVD